MRVRSHQYNMFHVHPPRANPRVTALVPSLAATASTELRNNAEIVRAAIENGGGYALEYAGETVRNDVTICTLAVKSDGETCPICNRPQTRSTPLSSTDLV